jgi:predicted nucleic acid-binding protein
MIVLDASAVIEFLLRTPTGADITGRIEGETLAVPHLVDVEVAQVMRRYERARAITTLRARQLLLDLVDLDATRYPHDVLVARVWQLRGNLTAYDAVYVSLAEALGATLVTCDGRLARAPGHGAHIEHFA